MRHVLPALICLAALPAAAQDAADGAQTFAAFCATCHGEDARGGGPMAKIMAVAPPDLTGLSARAGGTFPLAETASRIDGRDPLLAHGGEMPLFGAYFERDGADVAIATPSGQPMLTSRPIADLLAYLMSVQE